MKLKTSILLFSAIFLSACNNNIGSSGNPIKSSLNSKASNLQDLNSSEPLNLIPSNDNTSTPSGECLPTIANSSDGQITATLTTCPRAKYVSIYGAKLWQKQEILVNGSGFKLKFNANAPSDLHLSEIYNDLKDANGEAVGHIEQIDTSDCDKLIKSNHSAGQSCSINFAYLGDSTNAYPNNIHFIFSSAQRVALDFSFEVKNQLASDQNTAVLVPDGTSFYQYNINNIWEDSTHSALTYHDTYTSRINNLGDATLEPFETSSTIKITKSTILGVTANNLYFIDNSETSCGKNSVTSGQSCAVNFMDGGNDEVLASKYGRLNYAYYANDNNEIVTKPFVIGVGDLAPADYALTINDPQQKLDIEVAKINYGDNGTAQVYSTPMSGLQFYLTYTPTFFLATHKDGNKLFYSYGDNANLEQLSNGLTISQQQLACLEAGFDPQYDLSPDLQIRKCGLDLQFATNPWMIMHNSNKPLGFVLHAKYTSMINHKQIDQFVGTISMVSGELPAVPNGKYQDDCSVSNWNGSTLQAHCTHIHTYWGYQDFDLSLDYKQFCQTNSGVHLEKPLERTVYLACDKPKN